MAGMTKDLHRLMKESYFKENMDTHGVKRDSLMIKSKAAVCSELFLFMDFICRRTLCVGTLWKTVNWEIDLLFSKSVKVLLSAFVRCDSVECRAKCEAPKMRQDWDFKATRVSCGDCRLR